MNAKPNAQRYHGLDLLRGSAMLLGLVLHAPLIYFDPMIAEVFFEDPDLPDAGLFWDVVIGWIHMWRMPLFFMLAGFFTQLVLLKKGVVALLRDRFVRIALTGMLFLLLMNSVTSLPWNTMLHLWFLYVLIVITVIYAALYSLGRMVLSQQIGKRLTRSLESPLILLAVVGLAIFAAHIGRQDGIITTIPFLLGELDWRTVVFHGLWFAFGVLLYMAPVWLTRLQGWRVIVTMLVGGMLAMLLLFALYISVNSAATPIMGAEFQPTPGWRGALMSIFSGLCTLFLCGGAIGLAQRLVPQTNRVVNFLVELSYPLYLVHVIPTVIISAVLHNWGLLPMQAVPVTIVASFVTCVLIYWVFIKFTPLNWIVNGYNKSWLQLPKR